MLNEFNVKTINGEGVSLLTVCCQRSAMKIASNNEMFYNSSFFYCLFFNLFASTEQ